jgi:hypothetical protein
MRFAADSLEVFSDAPSSIPAICRGWAELHPFVARIGLLSLRIYQAASLSDTIWQSMAQPA